MLRIELHDAALLRSSSLPHLQEAFHLRAVVHVRPDEANRRGREPVGQSHFFDVLVQVALDEAEQFG